MSIVADPVLAQVSLLDTPKCPARSELVRKRKVRGSTELVGFCCCLFLLLLLLLLLFMLQMFFGSIMF